MKRREPSLITGGIANWYSNSRYHCGELSKKLKINLSYDPTIHSLAYAQRPWHPTPHTLAQPCSLLLYSQQQGNVNNLRALQQLRTK